MFTTGDIVVHKRYGAGTVVGMRTLQRKGKDRRYFCIEMAGEAGTLMIPDGNVESDDLRMALNDTTLIKEVLFNPPEDLTDDHRLRKTTIETKLSTRNPRQVVQVLRDLCWREKIAQLTTTDERLKRSALDTLLKELNLNPKMQQAKQKVDDLIEQAMHHHELAQAT
jgi:RNA polymerase-interacting CarD/CdnL/TRCF family regulator